MTDKKISELPAASLPLAGTENVPVVQGSETRRVAASELGKTNGFLDLSSTDPASPSAGSVRMFRRDIGGRSFPAFLGSNSAEATLQPFLGKTRIVAAAPAGNGTSFTYDGSAAFTSSGTITARNVATTNLFTRARRIGYVTAATAGSVAGWARAATQFTTGAGSGVGGFFMVCRFGFSAVVSDMRAFVGIAATSSFTNVEPSTLTNCVGVGKLGSDTNLSIFYGGTSAQTPIPLGTNFPANTANVDLYEIALFSPSTSTGTVHWQISRLNTGNVIGGTLTGGSAVLPSATTLLNIAYAYVSNNTTATAVAIDLVSFYAETDY